MPGVIVDTSVWVPFFRSRGSPEHLVVDRLLERREATLVGAVLAEVLQGARSPQEFEQLSEHLIGLPYAAETRETWATVGALSYQLRQRGVTLGLVDLLIAALALEHDCEVYTLDEHFRRIPGVKLHAPGAT